MLSETDICPCKSVYINAYLFRSSGEISYAGKKEKGFTVVQLFTAERFFCTSELYIPARQAVLQVKPLPFLSGSFYLRQHLLCFFLLRSKAFFPLQQQQRLKLQILPLQQS